MLPRSLNERFGRWSEFRKIDIDDVHFRGALAAWLIPPLGYQGPGHRAGLVNEQGIGVADLSRFDGENGDVPIQRALDFREFAGDLATFRLAHPATHDVRVLPVVHDSRERLAEEAALPVLPGGSSGLPDSEKGNRC